MRIALCFVLLAGPVWAEGLDVAAALTGRTVDYDAALQTFHADGTTDYVTDRPSAGRWVARDGRYCSQWPPSTEWACYDLRVEGLDVVFTDDRGNETTGRLRP
ncbi:MAG: hypothetical protein AAGF30_02075 [Pseudomonadota bacterium]